MEDPYMSPNVGRNLQTVRSPYFLINVQIFLLFFHFLCLIHPCFFLLLPQPLCSNDEDRNNNGGVTDNCTIIRGVTTIDFFFFSLSCGLHFALSSPLVMAFAAPLNPPANPLNYPPYSTPFLLSPSQTFSNHIFYKIFSCKL